MTCTPAFTTTLTEGRMEPRCSPFNVIDVVDFSLRGAGPFPTWWDRQLGHIHRARWWLRPWSWAGWLLRWTQTVWGLGFARVLPGGGLKHMAENKTMSIRISALIALRIKRYQWWNTWFRYHTQTLCIWNEAKQCKQGYWNVFTKSDKQLYINQEKVKRNWAVRTGASKTSAVKWHQQLCL